MDPDPLHATDVPTGAEGVDDAWLARLLGGVTTDQVVRVGADRGFTATLLRVRGRRDGGAPLDVVVKLTSAGSARREAWFLRRIAPATPLQLPTVHALAVDDERGAVVLDFVEGKPGDSLRGATPELRRALAGVLARLHARWARAEDPLLAPVRDTGPPRYTVRPERLAALLAARADELDDADVAWLREVAERAPAAGEHLAAGPVALVHGDVHLDNVLLVGPRPVLLDWEGVRLGTPAEDVAALARLTTRPLPDEPADGVAAAVREYRELAAVCGEAVDPDLDARVRSALTSHAAGALNWLGRLAAEPPARPRVAAVAEQGLHEVLRLREVV